MEEHPAFLVHSHLGRFLDSRGLAPTPPLVLDRVRFVTELEHIGYSRVDARDPGGRVTVILLLGAHTKYAEQGPQLRSLVASLDSEGFSREGRLAEVIVVAPEPVLGKKNMTDVIRAFQAAAAAGRPLAHGKASAAGGARRPVAARFYNMYAYHVFSLDVPRAQCVPRHTIMPPAEVAALLKRERLERDGLPRVAASNPPVVWIGARPGDVVRIEAPSETAGISLKYRLVCP